MATKSSWMRRSKGESTPDVSLNESFRSDLNLSRSNEKNELVTLNNRLARYIEKVRQLEGDKHQMQIRIRSMEEAKAHTFKKGFDVENEEKKIRLDLEKAMDQLKGVNEILRDENGKLKKRIDELQHFNLESEHARIKAEQDLSDVLGKLKGLETEKNMWERDAQSIQQEKLDLQTRWNELEGLLEDERKSREAAASRLQVLLSEFEAYKLEQNAHMEKVRSEYVEKVAYVRTELERQHEQVLQESLDKVRKELEDELVNCRRPIHEVYEKQTFTLNTELERHRDTAADANNKVVILQTSLSAAEKERNRFADQNKLLDAENLKLKRDLEIIRGSVEQLTSEKHRLDIGLKELTEQYSQLLDAKILLHAEIAAYRGLLDGEEARLDMLSSNQKLQETIASVQMIEKVDSYSQNSSGSRGSVRGGGGPPPPKGIDNGYSGERVVTRSEAQTIMVTQPPPPPRRGSTSSGHSD